MPYKTLILSLSNCLFALFALLALNSCKSNDGVAQINELPVIPQDEVALGGMPPSGHVFEDKESGFFDGAGYPNLLDDKAWEEFEKNQGPSYDLKEEKALIASSPQKRKPLRQQRQVEKNTTPLQKPYLAKRKVQREATPLQKKRKQQQPQIAQVRSIESEQAIVTEIKEVKKLPPTVLASSISPQSKSSKTHVVRSGETLWSIAKEYGRSWQEIQVYNNMNNRLIRQGQTLQIPSSPVDTSSMAIAATPKTAPNRVTRQKTSQVAQNRAAPALQPAAPSVASSLAKTHTVQRGDTLWRLSQLYKTTIAALQEVNALSDYTLQTGSVIRIP